MNNKKGFVFTAVVVLILLILVLAVSYYVQTINEREQRAEEKFKFIAMGQIFDMVSEEEIGDFAEMSSFYALYSLNDHIINKTRPLKQLGTATETDGNKATKYVNMSIYSLMTEGNVPVSYFSDPAGGNHIYGSNEMEKYTFTEWGDKINQICAQLGYVCNISDIRNFTFKQIDPWNVNIYFEATTNVESNDGRFNRTQDIAVNRTFSIEGFNDAAVSILIKDESGNETAKRQIFKYKGSELDHPNVEDIDIELISDDAERGKGFFYGPIVDFTEIVERTGPIITNISTNSKSPKYLLSSKASDWIDLTDEQKNTILNSYGGFIVTNVVNTCTEYNVSATNSGSFIITMCEGKPGQTDINIDLRCEVTCSYQDCDATLCPFDCYEGLTDCSWDSELNTTSSTVPIVYHCDISNPSDYENIFDIFKTKYSVQYNSICNSGSVSLPPGLGTGTITHNVSKPYLMYDTGSSFSLGDVEKPSNYNGSDEIYGELSDRQFVLINNENDHDVSASDSFNGFHELWNLDDLREMVMCGAYIETNKSDVSGPSFFQRMVESPWTLDSDNFGLETFLVGPYAGGYHNEDKDELCQLDRNFARDKSADHMIKGMPGCNSFDMTTTYMDSDDPVTEFGIGHFTITDDIMGQYGLERITCVEDNGARCE